MKTFLLSILLATGLSSCGYNLGFSKPAPLQHAETVTVEMFENNSLEHLAGILVTNAVADTMQRDGTFKLASSGAADICIRGTISEVQFSSVRPNPENTYISSEIDLTLFVNYQVVDNRTGKTIYQGRLKNASTFFNESGNVQAARESALGYAAQKTAEDLQFVIMSS